MLCHSDVVQDVLDSFFPIVFRIVAGSLRSSVKTRVGESYVSRCLR